MSERLDLNAIPGAPGWHRGLLIRSWEGGLEGQAIGPDGQSIEVVCTVPGEFGNVLTREWDEAARRAIEALR